MSVGVTEVHAASAAAVIDLDIVSRMGFTAVRNAFSLNTAKDRVELGLTDLERVVMDVETLDIVVEIERERLIDLHRREISDGAFIERESEHPREELRRRNLVVRRHDRVI